MVNLIRKYLNKIFFNMYMKRKQVRICDKLPVNKRFVK